MDPRIPTEHICPGCGLVRVPNTELACNPCWFRLPVVYRAVVTRTHRFARQQPEPWRRAVARALQWYRDNPEKPA